MAGSFDLSEERKGVLYEHLVFNQLLHSAWSKDKEISIATFRSRGGLEVDFIVELEGSRFGVEVTAKPEMDAGDLTSLRTVKKEYESKLNIVGVHGGTKSKKMEGIWCHPWQVLFKELGL